jgi:hypothetical protein
VNPVCEPDQYDIADADLRPVLCDSDRCAEEGCPHQWPNCQPWKALHPLDVMNGRCFDYVEFYLIDEDDFKYCFGTLQ